jgi:hypothetical protein
MKAQGARSREREQALKRQRTGVSHLRREYGELGMPQVSFDFFERKLLGQL